MGDYIPRQINCGGIQLTILALRNDHYDLKYCPVCGSEIEGCTEFNIECGG